jgi:hypothetical protein
MAKVGIICPMCERTIALDGLGHRFGCDSFNIDLEYDALRAENERLQKRVEELEKALRAILGFVKSAKYGNSEKVALDNVESIALDKLEEVSGE